MKKDILLITVLLTTICSCESWYEWDCDYVETKEVKEQPYIPPTVDAVDLGVSVLWANMDVGATSVTDMGRKCSWGETRKKVYYDYDTYMWYDGNNYTKYCTNSSDGKVDYKRVLDADDDAASTLWGNGWRTPTRDEMEELLKNCYWQYTDSYNGLGRSGYIVYKAKQENHKGKIGGYSGYYSLSDTHIFMHDPYIKYWSGSLHEGYNGQAHCLYFIDKNRIKLSTEDRYEGCYVRAVYPIKEISIAEFLRLADEKIAYKLTGVVRNIKNTTYGNFDLVDNTDRIYIYGLLDQYGQSMNFANMGIKEGDRISLIGTYYLYNGMAEIKNARISNK